MSEKLRRIDPSLLGQLISIVGQEPDIAPFGSLAFDAVRTLAPFQLASMVVYHERGGARCLHHNFVEDEHLSGLDGPTRRAVPRCQRVAGDLQRFG